MCGACAGHWHARGFSREHLLKNRSGETRSYLGWVSLPKVSTSGNVSASVNAALTGGSINPVITQTPSAAADGAPYAADASENVASTIASADSDATVSASVGGVTNRDGDTSEISTLDVASPPIEDSVMMEFVEAELNDEQLENGGEGDDGGATAGVQEGRTDEEDVRGSHDSDVQVTAASSTTSASALEGAVATEEQQSPRNGGEVLPEEAVPTAAQPNAEASTATASPASAAVTASAAVAPPVELEKLLRWFPTKDRALVDMLAARINAALSIEDALMCARFGKCKEPVCRAVVLHYEHCKHDTLCADPACAAIAVIYRHRRTCQNPKAISSNGDEKSACPFCIRIRQRRNLGAVVALDHVVGEQRRTLRDLQDTNSTRGAATRNFCLQNISMCTKRREQHVVEIDKLNRLASESSVPMFNFPKYNWHFRDAAIIKKEPAPAVESSGEASSKPFSPPANDADASSIAETEAEGAVAEPSFSSSHEEAKTDRSPRKSSTGPCWLYARCHGRALLMRCVFVLVFIDLPDDTSTSRSETGPSDQVSANSDFRADFIDGLLRTKGESGDTSVAAQQDFDTSMELGYAIVDASFCAPAKAQRCLLNCQSILVHLQHHLDLQVCAQGMCTAVEHHFAHLSKCKAREENASCEYCLRVQEREFARAVDMMEADQPEAEARVQAIINAITSSFTNDPPEEREQAVLQLEDELDQAEENKRELADKLSASRLKLRKVRKSLERRGVSTTASQRLPLHFVKVRPREGSAAAAGGSKKRRLLGSLD
ncbi:hypothetical protein BBJ28_00005267 [Nothophytophthora sp. Chile5]|nr:hypothetical protein BBJ28_00005267 [Nothophytophthora sp. Chile5]